MQAMHRDDRRSRLFCCCTKNSVSAGQYSWQDTQRFSVPISVSIDRVASNTAFTPPTYVQAVADAGRRDCFSASRILGRRPEHVTMANRTVRHCARNCRWRALANRFPNIAKRNRVHFGNPPRPAWMPGRLWYRFEVTIFQEADRGNKLSGSIKNDPVGRRRA